MKFASQRHGHWIGGQDSFPPDAKAFSSFNPVDDREYAHFPRGTAVDIDAAVKTAQHAFRSYGKSTAKDREAIIQRAADLLERRRDDVFDLLVDEIGSPRGKAMFEFSTSVSMMRAAAGMARAMKGATIPSDTPGRLSMSFREPIGVVASITPFNVPLIKGVRLSANPLALGNTVVMLPSEFAPGPARLLAEVYKEAGLPDGAFNVVAGFGEEIGDSLTTHPDVAMVTFTGSSRVGQHIRELCARNGKKVTLELGGKSPMVVMADADLDRAVADTLHGIFTYQGQVCMGNSRIYVQRSIFDEFSRKFADAAGRLSVGSPRDPDTQIGPIISARQRERVNMHVRDAVEKGATALCGNAWTGNCCHPTVLTGVTSNMTVYHEETFGPVAALYPFDELEEAIEAANDTRFGLSSAIFTSNIDAAMHFVSEVRAGMVHVNGSALHDEPHVPFGGIKDSGFGREGTEADIEAMTELKWVTIKLS